MLKDVLKKYLPKNILNFLIRTKVVLNSFYNVLDNFYDLIFSNEYFIDKKRKIIFFVISKNACSSIKVTFSKRKFKDDDSVHSYYYRHSYAGIEMRRSVKIRKEEKNYFKFAVVRNPFDRLYSGYKNRIASGTGFDDYQLGFFFRGCKNFNDFVKKVTKLPNFLSDPHFQNQYSVICDKGGSVVDCIVRFENLEKDFEKIRKKYDLEELPHFNRSQDRKYEWMDHYTKEFASLVHKKYKRDFDLWYPDAYDELNEYLDKKMNKIEIEIEIDKTEKIQ